MDQIAELAGHLQAELSEITDLYRHSRITKDQALAGIAKIRARREQALREFNVSRPLLTSHVSA